MSKQRHLSRLAAPATWPIERKATKWIAKPLPGPHSISYSIPLIVIARDLLKIGKTEREIRIILHQSQIKVNGKVMKQVRFPVGLFDVISILPLKKHYRVSINNLGKLSLVEVSASEENLLPVKIIGKKAIKNNKVQVNLSNGWNFISENKDYKVGDGLIMNAKDMKVSKHLPLKKGAVAFIISGKHSGKQAIYNGLEETGILKKIRIASMSEDKESFKTSLNNIFVIGESKAEVTVR